jgi:hypothetical protein
MRAASLASSMSIDLNAGIAKQVRMKRLDRDHARESGRSGEAREMDGGHSTRRDLLEYRIATDPLDRPTCLGGAHRQFPPIRCAMSDPRCQIVKRSSRTCHSKRYPYGVRLRAGTPFVDIFGAMLLPPRARASRACDDVVAGSATAARATAARAPSSAAPTNDRSPAEQVGQVITQDFGGAGADAEQALIAIGTRNGKVFHISPAAMKL